MPILDLPETGTLLEPIGVTFQGFSSSLWLLVMGASPGGYGYVELGTALPPYLIEMPLLVPLTSVTVVPPVLVTDDGGVSEFALPFPPDGSLIGATFVFQAANVDPSFPIRFRLSNASAVTVLP